MLNLSKLLYNNTNSLSLLHEITLPQKDEQKLVNAKNEIREILKKELPNLLEKSPTPRFFIQGSWAYKTLNVPYHPTQQIDLDDGCYLPVDFLANNEPSPECTASAYFKAVEKALASALKPGWNLDTSKDTCIRVELSSKEHIDIPLYAIPKEDFLLLENQRFNRNERDLKKSWEDLDKSKVLLATRPGIWRPSDSREIKNWFIGEVTSKGEKLRRITRYLKAIRDFRWEKGGPASILLMVLACESFNIRDDREDTALSTVLNKIPGKIREGVKNPCDANESLTTRLGEKECEEAACHFEEVGKLFNEIILSTDPKKALANLQKIFGKRACLKESLISVVTAPTSPLPTIETPIKTATPVGSRTKAG